MTRAQPIVESTEVSVAQQVAARIRDAVRSGRLAPGQRITEALLTAEFGVSRGPVREALRTLEVDGILSFEKNRGVSVRRLTRDDFVYLLEVREALESLAARLLARNSANGPIVDGLAKLFEGMERAMKRADLERYNLEFYVPFHSRLVEASDNPVLVRHWHQLNLDVLRNQFRALVDLDLLRAAHIEHVRLLDALRARSAAGAERAARQHIAMFTEYVRRLPDRVFTEGHRAAPTRRGSQTR